MSAPSPFQTMAGTGPGGPEAGGRALNSGAAAYVIGRLVSQVLEFLLWVVAVRTLSLGSAGVLAVALLATRYAGFVADWGATFTGARDVAQRGAASIHIDKLLRRREGVTLAVTVAFVIVVIVIGSPELVPLSGLVLFRGLNRDWVALGTGRQVGATIPNLAAQSLSLGLGLALSADMLPVAYGLGGLLGLVLSLSLNPRPTVAAETTDTSPNAWYVVAGLAGLVYTTIDTFMLEFYTSSEEVAVYASIYRIVNAWLLMVGLSIGAAVPQIAAVLAESPHRRPQVRSMLSKVAVICTAGVIAATPLVLWISPQVFGPEFEIGRNPLAILMLAAAITTLGAPFQALVIVDGTDRASAGVMVFAAVFNIVANLIAIPAYGMTGAAATTLVSQAMPAVFYWSSARRNPA